MVSWGRERAGVGLAAEDVRVLSGVMELFHVTVVVLVKRHTYHN